jgi:hydrogenase maturation protease
MNTALIGGIGNVLLGDDGVGPYLVRLLESQYEFAANVEVADLGTPALDLTHRIAGLYSLILADSVADSGPPGTVVLYRKPDIVRQAPAQRLDPHSPALSECLLAAEMLGATPRNVLLVGIVGETFDPGRPLSAAVRRSLQPAMDAVLQELSRLGFAFRKRELPLDPGIWWADSPPAMPTSLL